MGSRRWKGDVVTASNPRFTPGSPEHTEYKLRQIKYYRNTADAQRGRAKLRVARKRERNQQWVVNFLDGKVCSRCGISDHRVLAFDHVRGDKFANVSDLVSGGAALHKLMSEVAKCRVLCHNCHMLHTFEQAGGTYHDKLSVCSESEFYDRYGDLLT